MMRITTPLATEVMKNIHMKYGHLRIWFIGRRKLVLASTGDFCHSFSTASNANYKTVIRK